MAFNYLKLNFKKILEKMKIRVDSYEAGSGAIGGLATFHNNLFPRLVKRGYDVKTFSMKFREDLPNREDYQGVIVRRPSSPVDTDIAYAWIYDILHQMQIDVDYLSPSELAYISHYFTRFACVPSPYRMSLADLFIPNDWMSFPRSALYAWMHSDLTQLVFIHSTEPGRCGGIVHTNYRGTSQNFNDIKQVNKGLWEGHRLIRDLEFQVPYKVLERQDSIIMTVSKIHKKEYLLGVEAHGGKIGKITDRVFSVYHGVDVKSYKPMNVEKNEFKIGFIGRCSRAKGIDIIPKLAKILKNRIPVKFHIVTKTDKMNPYYFNLNRFVHENSLENVIIDNTFYVGEEKIKLINSWDAVIVPSRYEPQGQVDLEAMSCGVPPLVGLGGLREKVIDGYDGVWINPNDVEETAVVIVQLYKGRYKDRSIEEIGKNARDSAEKIWDWEKRADAYKELTAYLYDSRIRGIKKDLLDLLLPTVDLKR